MKQILFFVIAISFFKMSFAQSGHADFPQAQMNAASQQIANKSVAPIYAGSKNNSSNPSSPKSIWSAVKKMNELKKVNIQNILQHASKAQSNDTIFVGLVPNDTLKITGNWTHKGPIFVVNNGVLIFRNATIIDSGDVYVFQNGQLLADSSSLTFPQQYFYERTLIASQNSYVRLSNCSLNYSGKSHCLALEGSARVDMHKIHHKDWTTCGLFGKPTLNIHGCNIGGEYILSDNAAVTFNNVDTLLLWYQFPDTAVVNYTFPNGNAVNDYSFNHTIPGITGIGYNVRADSCHDVMWAMMPVNGSNITISNSTVRAIGTLFQHGDTVNVSDLNDNSSYQNFIAPLSDRNLHLINTNVQTWNLYVLDKSRINIARSQVGEVGTEGSARVYASPPFLLDGSGGYFWATDTSTTLAFNATISSYVRSEKNGMFVLAYGCVPFSAPQAIGNSVMICVQSTLTADPVSYDASTIWLTKIDGPDTTFANTAVPVSGSAWIDWAMNGTGWMNFASYSMYYQAIDSLKWINFVKDTLLEMHHGTLANWKTHGLATGDYNLKLTVKNNFNDSVEAIKQVTLKTDISGIAQLQAKHESVIVYPNSNNGIFTMRVNEFENTSVEIYNVSGQKVLSQGLQSIFTIFNLTDFSNGAYQIRVIKNNSLIYRGRVVKE